MIHASDNCVLAAALIAMFAPLPVAAADAIDVTLVNYGPIYADSSERYKFELESIGAGVELTGSGNNTVPLSVSVPNALLSFRVLASQPLRRDATLRTYSFHVGDTGYYVPQIKFDPVGKVLTTQTISGDFSDILGFGLDIADPLTKSVSFDLENEEVRLFIRNSDVSKIEGEDILFGSFDRLYFEAYDSLFEVSVATVTEPSSWALMVTGLGLVGGAIRRRPALA